MQLTLPVSATDLESAIPAVVFAAWSTISGWQLISAKIRAAKCLVCGRRVQHQEQAQHVPVACHERCHFLAKLMAKE
jgi:hypothetical protein